MTAALEGGEWSAARPGRTLPPGKTRYPFYRRLGGPQGRSGWSENLVPTGIRSRTVQPVVSRYTDWATGHTWSSVDANNFPCNFRSEPFTSTDIISCTSSTQGSAQVIHYFTQTKTPPQWVCLSVLKVLQSALKTSASIISLLSHDSVPIATSGLCVSVKFQKSKVLL